MLHAWIHGDAAVRRVRGARLKTFVPFLIFIQAISFGEVVAPPFGARIINRLRDLATNQGSSQAIVTLEAIVEGRFGQVAVPPDLGLDPIDLTHIESPETRIYAIRALAATGRPEAIAYLDNVKPDLPVFDEAKIILAQTLFRRETDPARQYEFLQQQLLFAKVHAVSIWAATELCDRGNYPSFPAIQETLNRLYGPGPQTEGMIGFCKAKIDILARDPDRVKALATVLRVDENELNILSWAKNELLKMNTPEAQKVLQDYVLQIEAASRDHSIPGASVQLMVAQQIRRQISVPSER
jgi:hypothetical protein